MFQDKFELLTQQEVVRLREEFTREVEEASNKNYAKKYFHYTLFERCKYLPYQSVFFNELIKIFDHFSQLRESQAIDKTMEHIAKVQKKSKSMSEFTMNILLQIKVSMKGDEKHYFESLPDCYQHQILFEGNTLDELYDIEKKIGSYSKEKILKMLATYKASQVLYLEISPNTNLNDSKEETRPKNLLKNGLHKRQGLTRLQQVLMFQYFCKLANIDQSNCKGSDFAFVFLNFMGVSSEVNGTDIYKMILNPSNFCTDESMIQNLKVVRSQFEIMNNPKPIQLINKTIVEIERKMKKTKS